MTVSINQKLHRFNSICETFVNKLNPSDYLTFGQDLASCVDSQHVHESLVVHRFLSKWARPDNSITNRLKTECFDAWLSHEKHLRSLTEEMQRTNWFTREHWVGASIIRTWMQRHVKSLHNLLEGKFDFDVDIEFTPGETYTSARGLVSVKQKLMSDKWTVTWEVLPHAIKLVMNHYQLREVALNKLLPHMTDPLARRLFWQAIGGVISFDRMFEILLVTYLFHVVTGARASSVEKNNEKRRFINIEPLFNVIFQRLVGLIIRDALSKTNDLKTGQRVHRALIRSCLYSTIDLRNASDSNLFIAAERYVKTACPVLWQCVQLFRSYTTTITYPDGRVIEEVNFKVSSMGNGFTFELMTLILLSQARVFDPNARVYGDDIVIKNNYAYQFINLIRKTGWEVNTSKTFINSKFRESCGGFFHDDIGDLVSFDFHFCENLQDMFIFCNKLRAIIQVANDNWKSSPLLRELEALHTSLVGVIPAEHKGPQRDPLVPQFNVLRAKNSWADAPHEQGINRDYVEVDKPSNAYKHSKVVRALYQKHLPLLSTIKAEKLIHSQVVGIIKIPRYKERLASKFTKDNIDVYSYASALYSGAVIKDTIRGKGTWSEITCIVLSSGHIIPVAKLKTWVKEIRNYRVSYPKPSCYYPPSYLKLTRTLWLVKRTIWTETWKFSMQDRPVA